MFLNLPEAVARQLGADGSVHQWEYFVKIGCIGSDGTSSPYWPPGGYVICGSFEVMQEVCNDHYAGAHGVTTDTIPAGFGTG
jgi:hypothetical protein